MSSCLRLGFRMTEFVVGKNSAPRIAEYVYTSLLKQNFTKRLINRLILAALPSVAVVGNARVVLNLNDPVVSGALAFGVYEISEIQFMSRVLAPGQVVIDVGANVGLYTALAGLAVGPSGRVIACEPDSESFRHLQQTVKANALENVDLVNAAVSDKIGMARLYVSPHNRGDNRLYPSGNMTTYADVETVRLDHFLRARNIDVIDVVKVDVQGYEGHVLESLWEPIKRSKAIKMLIEFWPDGLRQAGTDPVQMLKRLEEAGLAVFELMPDASIVQVADKLEFTARWPGRKYTNLVLLGPEAVEDRQ